MGKDNIRGMQCVELIPGANHYIKHEEPDPNEANRQGEVKVYRLNPDGTKGELLRTEPAYPEGWDKLNNNIKNRRGKQKEENMARYNWDELWPQVLEMQAQGKKNKEIAAELGIDLYALKSKIYREKKASEKQQTPTPEPVQVGSQDPAQGEEEPADDSVSQDKPEITICELPKEEKPRYFCEVCGALITDDEGITTTDGSWVCDKDSCRWLDKDNDAYKKDHCEDCGAPIVIGVSEFLIEPKYFNINSPKFVCVNCFNKYLDKNDYNPEDDDPIPYTLTEDPAERALFEIALNAQLAVKRVINDPVALALIKSLIEQEEI